MPKTVLADTIFKNHVYIDTIYKGPNTNISISPNSLKDSMRVLTPEIINELTPETSAHILYSLIYNIVDENTQGRYKSMLELYNKDYVKVMRNILNKLSIGSK